MANFTLNFQDSGINEETIREGTLETWPEFDANNDGYVDLTEYTSVSFLIDPLD